MLTSARPALAAYLAGEELARGLLRRPGPLIRAAAPLLAALPAQWAHGDWHPSNLTWTSAAPDARVAGIFDLGLANRTSAVHDLALALERAVVSWLDLPDTGTARASLAAAAVILDATIQTVRPLSAAEAAALPAVLPVVHLEYALSEVEYFTGVVNSTAERRPGRRMSTWSATPAGSASRRARPCSASSASTFQQGPRPDGRPGHGRRRSAPPRRRRSARARPAARRDRPARWRGRRRNGGSGSPPGRRGPRGSPRRERRARALRRPGCPR